jgi:tRNA A-37 threonylcarbamoyl transferase component Bud32
MITKLKLLKKNELINYLNNLPIISKFNNMHTSSVSVCLIEGYLVKKKCINDSLGNFMFWNEIRALQKLSSYPHFPFLIAYDSNSLIIYMTYCGPSLSSENLPTNWKIQFEEIKEIMEITEVNSNDMIMRNICCLGDEIKIIDFGLHTIFGRTIKEVLNDFYIQLQNIDKRNNTQSNQSIINNSYNLYYPNWKENLHKYLIIKTKYNTILKNMKNKKKR